MILERSAVIAGVCLIFSFPLRADLEDQIESKQRDLKKIQRELDQKQREKKLTEKKARELSEEVDRISKELKSSRAALKDLDGRLLKAESERAAAEDRLWASKLGLDQWKKLLGGELSAYYEIQKVSGDGRFLELAYRRGALQDKITGLNFALQHHAEVKNAHDDMVSLELRLQNLKDAKSREEDRVQAARKQMKSLYNTIQGRQAVIQKEIQDLNASAKKFEELIQKLAEDQREAQDRAEADARRSGEKIITPARGAHVKFPWPIPGTVVEKFGRFKHPDLDTYVFSNGIRIRPSHPGGVRVVEKGDVLFAGEFMGYGLMALVSHPGNLFTVYAHLGRLDVSRGQTVATGQIIGSSGTDDGGKPEAYFEIRSAGVAVDPLLWLQQNR